MALLAVLPLAVVGIACGTTLQQDPIASSVVCEVEIGNHCRAACGDVVLDISDVLTYPVRTGGKNFVYAPCYGVYCTPDDKSKNITVAVCQLAIGADEHFYHTSCAAREKIEWILEKRHPYKFSVQYKGGSDGRQAVVSFIEDPAMIEPQFTYVGTHESSILVHNFEVRGRYVGQPRGHPQNCTLNIANSCMSSCAGGVKIDISSVFTYPTKTPSGNDTYTYSPCNGYACGNTSNISSAVCQSNLSFTYKLGDLQSGGVVWLNQTFPYYIFTAVYRGGDAGRQAVVTFIEEPLMYEPKLTYLGENPRWIYNFEVRGSAVGQPQDSNQCTLLNRCVANCAGEMFDISSIFSYPAKALSGNFTYSYSPCGNLTCGKGRSSLLCQTSSNFSYSLGDVNSIKWWVNQSSPNYIFTIEYMGGDGGRSSRIKFVEDSKLLSSIFIFNAEQSPLEYDFEVRGRDVGQPGAPDKNNCMADKSNPCVFRCNGSVVLNISDVFKYPVSAISTDYTFAYSPCNGLKGLNCGCPYQYNNSAMCQTITVVYNPYVYGCGNVSAVQWRIKRTNPLVFSILYSGGDTLHCDGNKGFGYRSSEVTFYEDRTSVGTPTFKFFNEDENLTYTFEVRGSYVGQRVNRSDCVVDPSTPCAATCNQTVRIDLSKIFANPITIPGPEGNNFIFSPCVGYTCGSPEKNSSVCQGRTQSYGQLNSVKWTITQTHPFYIFTLMYTGGDKNGTTYPRRSTVTFIENSEVNRIVAVYAGSLSASLYLFDVVGSCIGQPSCTGYGEMVLNHPQVGVVLVTIICVIVFLMLAAVVTVWVCAGGKTQHFGKKGESFIQLAD